MRFGIDYAWHDSLDPVKLRGVGVTFAARYFARSADSKRLSADEAKRLSAAGIDIVTVWETTTTRAEGGSAAGADDGARAVQEAHDVGQPRGSGIYAAVDEDTTVGPHITGYFQAFTKACHDAGYRSGVYGSYVVVEECRSRGLCDLGWQTYAWSGGRVSSHAQLYQYSNGHYVSGLGGECDFDHSLADDFGQWRLGGSPPPPPPPLGHLPLRVDGDFGPQTVAATQRVCGATVDGIWGPDSKRALQRHLGVPADGAVGPVTIKALQRHVGSPADGSWGPNTTSALQRALNDRRF
jgi:hypothetical protein